MSGSQYLCTYGTSSTTFSSTVSGGTWSSSNSGIATVNSSTGLVTGKAAGTATITYTVGGSGGCTTYTATRTVYVASGPGGGVTSISGSNSVCQGNTATYTIVSNDANFNHTWSFSGTGVTFVVSADTRSAIATFASNATSGNVVVNSTNSCGSGYGNGIYVTVGQVPTAGTVSGTTSVCVAASTQPNITFSNPQNYGVNINYNINAGTTQKIYVNANSSSNLGVSTASVGTFTYNLVSVENGLGPPSCLSSISGNATVTVSNGSVAPTGITGTNSICSGSSTTLTLTGGTAAGGTARWYSGSCGGTFVGSGNSISVSPTSNTTYYVRYEGGCNTTACASRTVTINGASVAPTTISAPTTICLGSSTSLTVSGGVLGSSATANWYSGSCGGTLVGSGNTINVSPTITTTYYVRYEGSCNSTAVYLLL